MRARMDNTIHVEIQIIKLFIIGIWSSGVDGNSNSIDLSWMFFDYRGDNFGIFLAEPTEQCCEE